MPNSFVAVASNTAYPDAAYAFAKFAATYGNKYMFAAGHATTWTGVVADEILECVWGSKEEAEKWIDTESFTKYVIANGEPAYSEDYIVAYAELQALVDEYTMYVVNGEMTATVAQTPGVMAKEGVTALVELITSGAAPKDMYTACAMVTAENAEEYLTWH